MKPDFQERIVIDCLKYQGYKNIVFEPDGNVPPDILIDSKIAVEVRRLNQNKLTLEGFEGIEQDEFSISGWLKGVMKNESDTNFEKSAIVIYTFSRPLPDKKQIKREFRNILRDHKSCMDQTKHYKITNRLKISMIPCIKKLENQFVCGMSQDQDFGGGDHLLSIIYDNLKLVITEKEEKTKEYRLKYPKFWLAVVDTISHGVLSKSSLTELNSLPKIDSVFDRILLVSSDDYKSFIYLYDD